MAAWFWRSNTTRPSIDSLKLDTTGWLYHGEPEPGRKRVLETPEGDAVLLHFFDIAPNLPKFTRVEQLTEMYASGLARAGGKVVECTVNTLADCDAIWLTLKVPQNPSGMMYQCAVTVPFRDFSFVIKIQCPELGITGVREAVLLDQRARAGEKPDVQRPGQPFPGWNPDAAEHDEAFPAHPISRLRRVLRRVATSATIDDPVRRLPGFQLPRQ